MCNTFNEKYNKTKVLVFLEIHQINPHIRFAKRFYDPPLQQGHSRCYDCRLFFVKQGHVHLEIGEENYDLSKNSAAFFPPGTKYRFLQKGDENPLDWMILDFDLVCDYSHIKESLGTATTATFDPKKILSYQLPQEFTHVIIQSAPQLYESLEKCINEFLYKEQYYRETSSSLLKWCLINLLREDALSSNYKIVTSVMEYIHTYYANAELDNAVIAAHFNYHPYYLSQLIKQATGQTLHAHLSRYRIRIAKNYLTTTDMDINTISWKCGFNSTAYFIKLFKQVTGVTPKQYRNSHTITMF